MRRLYITFLTCLVLLPSLACAMPACSVSQPIDLPVPCHGQVDGDEISLDGFMILQACMDIDFQVAEKTSIFSVNDKTGDPFGSLAVIADTSQRFILASQIRSREPPSRRLSFHFKPSVILTTQRFRI